MRKKFDANNAFTLLELLIVIAVIAILAALLIPAIGRSKKKAQQLLCLNQLSQINQGIRMYSDDSNDASPSPRTGTTNMLSLFAGYKELMKNYVGLKGASSSADKLFACPADKFYPSYVDASIKYTNSPYYYVSQSLHSTSFFDYSSYAFNGGDNQTRTSAAGSWTPPGLTGLKLSSVKNPARTVLIGEASALAPWSWHDPAPVNGALPYNDAKNVISYVDGHTRYTKIYWDSTTNQTGGISFAFTYDPPANYDYQWSGNR